MSLKGLIVYIIVPYLLFMAGIIGLFLYKSRARNIPIALTGGSGESSIEIDCTEKLMADFSWKLRWIPHLPWLSLLAVYIFVVLNLGLKNGYYFSDLLNPKTRFFSIAALLFFLMAVGSLLGALTVRQNYLLIRKAYRLCQGKPQIFRADSSGLWIPTLLLVNPAIWRAADKNLTEIFVPYEDIERCEIYPQMGNSPAGYKLVVRGPSLEYGMGRLGQNDFLQFGIGIKRAPLRGQEARITAFMYDKLGNRLVTRTDDVA